MELVTAVMVTQPSRLGLAIQAIESFRSQTYKNKRLLIVVDDSGMATELASHRDLEILHVTGKTTLGDLRNSALDHLAEGIVVQWDDDDLYGPERISLQAGPILNNRHITVSLLRNQTVVIRSESHLRQVNKGIDGTIMHRIPASHRYQSLGKSEDAIFIHGFKRSEIEVINNPPDLYIRRYHGSNTWDLEHFRRIVHLSD